MSPEITYIIPERILMNALHNRRTSDKTCNT